MKWLKPLLIGLAALLAMAMALPYFISLDDYIPRIEEEASARLREPVSIKRIRFALLPMPHVVIDGIMIGRTGDIQLDQLRVTPDVFSLLQPTRIISSIEVESLTLTQKAIDSIPAWVKPDAVEQEQAPPVRVESLRFSNALVNLGKASFGPFDASLSLDSKGSPKHASITTRDGKFKALIRSEQSKYLIDVRARSWALPAGPALAFDELAIKGLATLHDASLDEVYARLYGGTATGRLAVNWQKGLKLEGNLDVSRVEMRQLASILSPGTRVSGKLSAKPVFSAVAASADGLLHELRLETLFDVLDGTLHGVDIQKAATHLVKQGTSGGETRFEQLSGHLFMEHGGFRLTHLKIASGALAADGNVDISPKKELSGRINAQVKAAGASASVPLNLAGTVSAPLLYPTGGTLAGAALGTVMLGPGLGTSVGAKVGGWTEGLFGKGKDQRGAAGERQGR